MGSVGESRRKPTIDMPVAHTKDNICTLLLSNANIILNGNFIGKASE